MMRRLSARARLALSVLFMALVVMALPLAGPESGSSDTAEWMAPSTDAARGFVERALPHRAHRTVRDLRAAPRTMLRASTRTAASTQALAPGGSDSRTRRAAPARHLHHAPTAPRAPSQVEL
jgi:hypothetical protein